MILKKKVKHGKTIYIPITKEEALNIYDEEELIFTDEKEKEDFYDEVEDDDDDDDEFDLSKKIRETIENVSEKITNAFEKTFNKNRNKSNKLVKMLPYMDKADIHDLISGMLNEEEAFNDICLDVILPFLDKKDCEKVFLKAVADGSSNYDPVVVAPYVSEKCLDLIVDQYVAGELEIKNIDALYPYLSKKNIRKIFEFIIKNN